MGGLVTLAVVRSIGSARRLQTASELEDFEQELIDQYAIAAAASGTTDARVGTERATVFEFVRFLARPVWTAGPDDADRFLSYLRKDRQQARMTVQGKAWTLSQFFNFVIDRYQGDIHALTGHVLVQPIDEYNRPSKADYGTPRIPPSQSEVESLFQAWGASLPESRKYLPAARDYLAASLWRRVGLRLNETVMLDMRDWRPDLGELGRLHVRFGKGSQGRGPKARVVPAIDEVDELLTWWLTDVRHQFGDDWTRPDAPLLPSERRDRHTGRTTRVGGNALREGLLNAVRLWLPDWQHRMTPHTLRHFCASTMYSRGVGLKAIQELLGHEWLSTTTLYVHVHDDHVEHAWMSANERLTARFEEQE